MAAVLVLYTCDGLPMCCGFSDALLTLLFLFCHLWFLLLVWSFFSNKSNVELRNSRSPTSSLICWINYLELILLCHVSRLLFIYSRVSHKVFWLSSHYWLLTARYYKTFMANQLWEFQNISRDKKFNKMWKKGLRAKTMFIKLPFVSYSFNNQVENTILL